LDNVTDDQLSGRVVLDAAIDALRELCEPVMPPKRAVEYRQYFLARNPGNAEVVARNAPRRRDLYAAIDDYERAWAALGGDAASAGYNEREVTSIVNELAQFNALRDELRSATGEPA
jgi:type I restriction enzyme R subunit